MAYGKRDALREMRKEGPMPQFFGLIDALYTDTGGSVWAHPAGGAPGLPPDAFLDFSGTPGTQGASTFAAAVTHAKATNSNTWIFYSAPDGRVSNMYVF